MRHHHFDHQNRPDPRVAGLREQLHADPRIAGLREHLHDMHAEFGQPPFPPGPPGFPPGPGGAFRGFPPGPGFGFGPGFAMGRGGRGRGHGREHGHGRGRARRGNVRAAVLILLAERPMHGYEIIQQISERSRGWWRPSPGSVYPTLQLLADEGLVTTDQESGKRLYSLTDEGRTEAEKQNSTPPWEQAADDVDPNDAALRDALSTLMGATMQLSAAGTSDLRAKAAKLLVETRRQLYLLLAEAGTETDQPVEDAVPDDDEF
ncbi:MAG TPA: PadR family transcriptional regulator [Pseudonocardiaceae bacterium]|jgi:DNA-binding PadR family transcriptional regulator|nr:PadR family transcriptional regulator [Pseudonocardiaceae bacterium]